LLSNLPFFSGKTPPKLANLPYFTGQLPPLLRNLPYFNQNQSYPNLSGTTPQASQGIANQLMQQWWSPSI
jgi:hypothetical protein